MTANETLQQTYVPDRKLRRYEQVVRKSRMPLNRQNQAIARYKQAQAEMQRWIDVAHAAFDRLGEVPVSRRLQLVSFARKLCGAHRRWLLPFSGSVLSDALPQTRY
jgi:hypothetical protein